MLTWKGRDGDEEQGIPRVYEKTCSVGFGRKQAEAKQPKVVIACLILKPTELHQTI